MRPWTMTGLNTSRDASATPSVVDTLGLVLRVWVSAANVGERKGAKAVLQRVKVMGQTVQRVITVWADGGYDGNPLH
jgi:transposase